MAKDSDSKDLFDFELPEGLDDDLGGDWESAFQAEDFMLTPEDEAEVFFEQDATGSDELDLASLLEGEDSHPKHVPVSAAAPPSTQESAEQEQQILGGLASFLPPALLTVLARFSGWFQSRPFYQKILFPGLAVSLILALFAVMFFRTTGQQLAERQPTTLAPPGETQTPASPTGQTNLASTTSEQQIKQAAISPAPAKNRKKWPMRAFFIAVPANGGTDGFLVRIDLNLVLLLDPGSNIPEDKRAFVRDTIFQFFSNRPPEVLRRYSLARGEMIRNLESWLHKEWPQNPIASIMFDRYQVIN